MSLLQTPAPVWTNGPLFPLRLASTPVATPLGGQSIVTLLDPGSVGLISGLLVRAPLAKVPVADGRSNVRQAADEPPEEQAPVASVAAVEAEDELIEVRVEVLLGDRSLVGTEQPALEEGGDPVHVRMDDVRFCLGLGERGRLGFVVRSTSLELAERGAVGGPSSEISTDPGSTLRSKKSAMARADASGNRASRILPIAVGETTSHATATGDFFPRDRPGAPGSTPPT